MQKFSFTDTEVQHLHDVCVSESYFDVLSLVRFLVLSNNMTGGTLSKLGVLTTGFANASQNILKVCVSFRGALDTQRVQVYKLKE